MGKNLKGKELGKGLYQRKDGRYETKAMLQRFLGIPHTMSGNGKTK